MLEEAPCCLFHVGIQQQGTKYDMVVETVPLNRHQICFVFILGFYPQDL